MTLNEFQAECPRTFDLSQPPRVLLCEYSMGLAGEAGELVDMLKKHVFYKKPLDKEAVVKECGDVLWYLSALAELLDIEMDEVARVNIAKLRARFPDGIDRERAIRKAENDPA